MAGEARRTQLERDIDLALDFSAGLLSTQAHAAVLERARTDVEFETLLRLHLGDSEAARLVEREWATQRRIRPRRRLALLAAAAAVAAVFALVLLRPADPSTEYWIRIEAQALGLRGDGGIGELKAAIAAYEARDIKEAREMLEALTLEDGAEDMRRFYLASVLMLSGETERGQEMLQLLEPETLPSPWREEALRLVSTGTP